MTIPLATARLQFHREFTLDQARDLVPYYAELGISHLYASPLTVARPGSTHGYDVIDHTRISPELGGEEALHKLVSCLREFGMGLILDIVPNHMATHPENAWWWSVLQSGAQSPYADWFDIDWQSPDPDLRGKILMPVLGDSYDQALAGGDVKLVYDESRRAFHIEAYGTPYPVAPGEFALSESNAARAQVDAQLEQHDATTEAGRERLHALLERQHYRLAWWRTAAETINWRRFFEVSELAGVCVERQPVFDAVHALPLRLYEEGWIDGVRVDHVDGLAYPLDYCRQLREALRTRSGRRPHSLANDEAYLVVEKILAHDEVLDERWAVHGTTGYDFMAQIQAVLHHADALAPLTALWEQFAGDPRTVGAVLRDARQLMLERHFPVELATTVRALHEIARTDPATRDCTAQAIGRALQAVLLQFPVYRTYADDAGRAPTDAARMRAVLENARTQLDNEKDGSDSPLLETLDGWLGAQAPAAHEATLELRRLAIRRFQQLTPPLAAKSLEDTTFYQYGRLLSANDVGSDPAVFAATPKTFLQQCQWRAAHAPHAMLTTATHDHKRGEDTRARLAVISENPEQWSREVRQWDRALIDALPEDQRPAGADRYMLYQTIVGAWPLTLDPADRGGREALRERVAQWQTKSLREGKLRSSWFTPDEAYEQMCATLLDRLLLDASCNHLLRQVAAFALHIAPAGAVNSLVCATLRLTTPGVPDLYQGADGWDFSLVDPDNRSPVDFKTRRRNLDALALGTAAASPAGLLADWRDGRIKQAVITRILQHRQSRADLYAHGTLAPLAVAGKRAQHVVAFMRLHAGASSVVVVPRHIAAGIDHGTPEDPVPAIDAGFWGDTTISLPQAFAGHPLWDVVNGCGRHIAGDGVLRASDALADIPVAVLTLQ